MSVAPLIRFDRAYFATARHVPSSVRVPLQGTIESIAADHPNLPGEHDVRVELRPTLVVWHRRSIPGTAWCVHFTWTADAVLIRSVIIP